jgi:hypothetical protein
MRRLQAAIEDPGKQYSEVFAWGRAGEGQVRGGAGERSPRPPALTLGSRAQMGLGPEAIEDEKYNKPTHIPDLEKLHIRTIGAGPVTSSR